MAESSLLFPITPAEEVNADTAEWRAAYEPFEAAQRVADDAETIELEVTLPGIVGYVPEQERQTLANWYSFGYSSETGGSTFFGARHERKTIADFASLLPSTFDMIVDDINAVSQGRAEVRDILLESKYTDAGQAPRAYPVHFDYTTCEDLFDRRVPQYLFSSAHATEFYAGALSARLSGLHVLPVAESCEQALFVPAPDFAIVRLGPATAHRSPVFTESGRRVFGAVNTHVPEQL